MQFAGGRPSYRSTFSFVLVLEGPNTWFPLAALSKKQGCVSLSTPEAELAAAQDAALRAQADAMNVQRRSEQEIDKARKFALERFCGDLLGVVDNLERAMESSSDAGGDAVLIEGIELTHKGFMDVLTKYGVVPVDPMGEPYDPETAQAMSMVEQPDAEPNTVVAVMQKGYTLNGRLLRPAMVMVSKAASGQ